MSKRYPLFFLLRPFLSPQRVMRRGITLAEILTVLAVLGIIVSLTIPKLITAQKAVLWRNVCKEHAASLSAAYNELKQSGAVTDSTKPADLIPYLNYVAIDTTGNVDPDPTTTVLRACNATNPCLLRAYPVSF
jgi:prepilin-type N-terminal cleavage/methylation domain-containing protein